MYENLLLSGGYNGSLVYWIAGQNQVNSKPIALIFVFIFLLQIPHTMIADAHRQSIDVIAWHPVGHLLATTSHDCILKFWCREPPGSRLEQVPSEANQENPPQYAYGPMSSDAPSIIPMKVNVGGGQGQHPQQVGSLGPSGGGRGNPQTFTSHYQVASQDVGNKSFTNRAPPSFPPGMANTSAIQGKKRLRDN
jgi:hypothetical protein